MEEENLTEKLFRLNRSIDKWWTDTRSFVEKLKARQDPRYKFNSWRNSPDGHSWKQQQYHSQNQKCSICGEDLDIRDSHIDHIKPLGQYPTEALNFSRWKSF
jgi:hypothetical protein